MKDNKKILIYSAMGTSLVGVILSILLVCKHNFPELCASGGFGCSLNGVDGCSELGKSDHSKLFGWLSISGIGFLYYTLMTLLFVKLLRSEKKEESQFFSLIAVLSGAGFLADIYFGIINFNALAVPCMLCAYSYFVTAVLLGITVVLYKKFFAGIEIRNLFNIFPGIAKSVLELLISLFLMVALFVVFTLFSGANRSQDSSEVKLLPEDEVEGIISHLNSLKQANLSLQGIPSAEGDKDAYIVIQKFADFRCPHCLHAGEILQGSMKRWPGRIKIYYRHFPLDGTCNPMVERKQEGGFSCNGAQAALCASREKYFAEFYHGLFQFQVTEKNLSLDNIKNLAESLGGNWNQMIQCMGSPQTVAQLNRDLQDAKKIELNSTPVLIINDRMLNPGTPNPDYLYQILDALVFKKEGKAAYQEFKERKP